MFASSKVFLQLLWRALVCATFKGANIGSLFLYHGGLEQQHREFVIKSFSAVEGPAILLSTKQAGGVSLTLIQAVVAIMAEPHWNRMFSPRPNSLCVLSLLMYFSFCGFASGIQNIQNRANE